MTPTMNTPERILITGGGGMLAHALLRALHARGRSAVAVGRAACDVTREADVRALFATHRPTLLLNCAAHTKVDQCEKEEDLASAINGRAVGLLARHARDHGTTLVHYSTDFVFDGACTRPYRPEDPVRPLSAYGRSKLLGEQELQSNPPARWLILRTAWLYGRNGPCFPRTMVNAARAGKPLKVVSDQTGCPTWTDDLADMTLELLDRGTSGVWHATNAGQTTWLDFTAAILGEFGLKTDLSPTTSAEWFKIRPDSAVRPAYSVLDVEPLSRALGRPVRPWRDALREYRRQVDEAGAL
jgi:dTDP-4-dehydrorhamnose reductase